MGGGGVENVEGATATASEKQNESTDVEPEQRARQAGKERGRDRGREIKRTREREREVCLKVSYGDENRNQVCTIK